MVNYSIEMHLPHSTSEWIIIVVVFEPVKKKMTIQLVVKSTDGELREKYESEMFSHIGMVMEICR